MRETSELNKKRSQNQISPELCVSLIVLDNLAVRSLPKHEILGLKPVVYSPIFTLIFIAAWKLIQLVTSQGCFGRAKMAANFGLNQPTSNGQKSSFQGALAKTKLTVFVSEVETLLLRKNLRYKNFVSVAL